MAFFNFNLNPEYNNAQIDVLEKKFRKHRNANTLEAERKIRTYVGYALTAYAYPSHLMDKRFHSRDIVKYHPAGEVLEPMIDYLVNELGYNVRFNRRTRTWKFTSSRNSYIEFKENPISKEMPECVGLMNVITSPRNRK